jgi:hypothetical protein
MGRAQGRTVNHFNTILGAHRGGYAHVLEPKPIGHRSILESEHIRALLGGAVDGQLLNISVLKAEILASLAALERSSSSGRGTSAGSGFDVTDIRDSHILSENMTINQLSAHLHGLEKAALVESGKHALAPRCYWRLSSAGRALI